MNPDNNTVYGPYLFFAEFRSIFLRMSNKLVKIY